MSSPSGTTALPASPNSAKLRDSPTKFRETARDRIDNILDAARSRKVAMNSAENSGTTSPRTAVRRNHVDGGAETESSADEETSIFRESNVPVVDYQSTKQMKPRTVLEQRSATTSLRRQARPEEEHGEADEDEHEGWWARMISKYGSIELENKGSVARDHLALERTFLAWLRTSLAFASIGIAITQLFRLNTTSAKGVGGDPYQHLRQMGKPLGATFLAISILMLGVGFHRYFESQHWIIRGKFPASRGSIALVAFITFALMITSLIVVVVVEPRAFEKR